ncbi:hypothetical protein BH10PSE1_BH10PSE1_33990 [soil metagenome]
MRIVSIPIFAAAALAVALGSTALAQTAAPATGEQTAPQSAPAAPAAPVGEDWNVISRSATRAYLVDVNSIKTAGDVSSANMVRAPLNPASPADKSYTLVEVEYRCAAKQSRSVAEIDHDEAGAALDRAETGEEFEAYGADSLFGFIGSIICDSARAAPPTYQSITAYFDAGRP